MPAGVDPDDFVKTEGAAAFRRLVEGARPMLDQFIQDSVQEATIQGTVTALETVAAAVGQGAEPDDARALRQPAGRRCWA